MIGFSSYSKVKNKYCVCYFGLCQEYLHQLLYLRPAIEKKFNDLEIHIACRDELYYLLEKERNTTKQSNLKIEDYGYTRELLGNMKTNPIYEFAEPLGLGVELSKEPLETTNKW